MVRATRAKKASFPFATTAERLRARLDDLDLSAREASRRWPRWKLTEWLRMLNGTLDPQPALDLIDYDDVTEGDF